MSVFFSLLSSQCPVGGSLLRIVSLIVSVPRDLGIQALGSTRARWPEGIPWAAATKTRALDGYLWRCWRCGAWQRESTKVVLASLRPAEFPSRPLPYSQCFKMTTWRLALLKGCFCSRPWEEWVSLHVGQVRATSQFAIALWFCEWSSTDSQS